MKKNLREWEKEKEGSEKRFGVGKKKLAEEGLKFGERERESERKGSFRDFDKERGLDGLKTIIWRED